MVAGPELQAGFRADVDQLDVRAHLCSPTGADGPVGVTGGEAVGGDDGGGDVGGGDAGAAVVAAGSRADVGRLGSGLRVEAQSSADTLARYY